MHSTQAIEIFGNVTTPFSILAIPDLSIKNYGDRPRETPPSGVKSKRGIEKYSDFGPFKHKAISRKRCKIGGKLLLITNRKSHMRFRLVPKW